MFDLLLKEHATSACMHVTGKRKEKEHTLSEIYKMGRVSHLHATFDF